MKTVILIFSTLLLIACGDAYPKLRPLNAKYTYWVATPDLVFIVTGDPKHGASTVIPEHIDRVAVTRATVFGHVTPYPDELAGTRTPESARGYFYLDLDTGEHRIGLSEGEWEAILLKRDIKAAKQQLKTHL